jgi:hypothetical protein
MVILDLRSWSPIEDTDTQSISMSPPTGSTMRNKASVTDDLPAPVLPTIPIYKRIIHIFD